MHDSVENGEEDYRYSAHFMQIDVIIKRKDAGETKPS